MLTQDQIDFYNENGYLKCEALFPPEGGENLPHNPRTNALKQKRKKCLNPILL